MKHVILGAGPVGRSLASALAARGVNVVLSSRTGAPIGVAAREGITWRAVDVRDERALAEICAGSTCVYQCLNAPYHRWAEQFPSLQRVAIAAARSSGARLVSFENVYGYGAPGPTPFDERSPLRPCSEKGRVRAAMSDELEALRRAGTLDSAQVRASDLFGPGVRYATLGQEVIGRAVRGLAPRLSGDPSMPHTWTFVADAGEALARVGLARTVQPVYHVPSDTPRSLAEVLEELARVLDRRVVPRQVASWQLRLFGLLVPPVGAMVEMLYQLRAPFIVGDAASREWLGQTPTAFAEALRQTVRWFAHDGAMADAA